MEYRQAGSFIVIRFDEDEEIVNGIVEICSREGFKGGVILSLVGAVKECELVFDFAGPCYSGLGLAL